MSIPPPEVTLVDKHRVACDGAEAIRGGPGFVPSALGHPRVWLEIDDNVQIRVARAAVQRKVDTAVGDSGGEPTHDEGKRSTQIEPAQSTGDTAEQ